MRVLTPPCFPPACFSLIFQELHPLLTPVTMNHETPINEWTGDSNTHEGQVRAPTATCRAALPGHAMANNDKAKERDAEKAKVFSGALSRVGLFAGVGFVIAALSVASEIFEVFDAELGIKWYVLGLGYCFVGTGIMLMSTLPPGTFDFDLAIDICFLLLLYGNWSGITTRSS